MARVNPSEPEIIPDVVRVSPTLLGVGFCTSAAVLYASANLCLRWLAVDADPVWSICVKESVALAVVGPWLAYLLMQGGRVFPGWQAVGRLCLAGLATQLLGNVPMLWALGIVGLTIAIPVMIGVNLVASALLSRVLLGERISLRSALALGLLIVAVILLSFGAGETNQSIAGTTGGRTGPLWVGLAVAACCLAGCAFAMLSIAIRSTVTQSTSPAVVVFFITAMAALSLGPLSVWRLGVDGILQTRPADFQMMLLTGALNLGAFASLTKGLQLTSVVYANVLSASQTALAAVTGMLVFHEPPNSAMVLGATLTVVGVVLVDHGQARAREETLTAGEAGES
jgi:DME family drug/metabolite transporter